MKAKGCLVALAVGLGLLFVVMALVGPRMLREGEKLYRPIAKIQGAQKDFEAWEEEHAFKEPETAAVSDEQLDRFVKLRKQLAAINEANPLPDGNRPRNQRPNLSEIEGLIEGVGGNMTGRMSAYQEIGMSSGEYRYLDRLIYRRWLRPLKAKGVDPASLARATSEILDAARSEKNAAVARRLRAIADELGKTRAPAPEGIPAEVHLRLLARAIQIDALIDVGAPLPIRRR